MVEKGYKINRIIVYKRELHMTKIVNWATADCVKDEIRVYSAWYKHMAVFYDSNPLNKNNTYIIICIHNDNVCAMLAFCKNKINQLLI